MAPIHRGSSALSSLFNSSRWHDAITSKWRNGSDLSWAVLHRYYFDYRPADRNIRPRQNVFLTSWWGLHRNAPYLCSALLLQWWQTTGISSSRAIPGCSCVQMQDQLLLCKQQVRHGYVPFSCRSCLVASYCGRKHQQLTWKNERICHKVLCPLFGYWRMAKKQEKRRESNGKGNEDRSECVRVFDTFFESICPHVKTSHQEGFKFPFPPVMAILHHHCCICRHRDVRSFSPIGGRRDGHL